MIDFTGKVALITGGGGAIGRAAAIALARAGAQVSIVDISRELALETAELVQAQGGQAMHVQADVSKSDDVVRYVRMTMEAYGRIDLFLNNAAWEGEVKPLVDYPDAVFDQVLAVNVRGVFLGLKHVLPVMRAQGSGAIVNTSSLAGHIGSPGLVAYTASKHAVLGMTKTAAMESAKSGIRVNAVSPGAVDTRMLRALAQAGPTGDVQAGMERYAADSPNGRLATPQDIANVMLFLLSDLSSHMSGQSLRVDGGRIMY